jgi:hypothetical protein
MHPHETASMFCLHLNSKGQDLMKAKLLIVTLSLIIAAACSKDKFDSKPTLTFESINGTSFVTRQTVSIKLRLTDKEGDFESDSGYMKQRLFFKRVSSVCADDPTDTIPLYYDIPAFTTNKYLDAYLDINFTYGVGDGQYPNLSRCADGKDDSLYFRFWIKDAADHVSDTISTPAFKLIKE